MMITSLYAGSFDPITKGNEWIINNAPGPVAVAVANDPRKTYRFTQARRVELVKLAAQQCCKVYEIGTEYLIDFAQSIGAEYIVRGIRSASDYEAERAYAAVNRMIAPDGPTHIFLMPPPEL